jgi:hypothetical protein
MESEICKDTESRAMMVLSIARWSESISLISSSKFLGSLHAWSNKAIAAMNRIMKRMAVKLAEAACIRGAELTKKQKPPSTEHDDQLGRIPWRRNPILRRVENLR